tara:strand:- start:18 stop:665 length:648 start_codon:yes stop_codon:yes gene_type:complete
MLNTNQIYPTNCFGSVKILNYKNHHSVKVQFIDTGYIYITRTKSILSGNLKDKLAPNVYGVGFIGDGKYNSKSKAYRTWSSMMARCYSGYYLTYKDCTVVSNWHNFQNFAEWFDKNYIHIHHYNCDLDIDIKFNGDKIYSAENCTFVSRQENSKKANAKNYTFISPDNTIVKVYNLKKFCIENELNNSAMSNVHKGKAKHHKGWIHDMELVEMVQ